MEEQILQILIQMQSDFLGMKKDISVVKQDVAGLKQDSKEFRKDIRSLKHDMAEVKINVSDLFEAIGEMANTMVTKEEFQREMSLVKEHMRVHS